jgi:hypothetical protein
MKPNESICPVHKSNRKPPQDFVSEHIGFTARIFVEGFPSSTYLWTYLAGFSWGCVLTHGDPVTNFPVHEKGPLRRVERQSGPLCFLTRLSHQVEAAGIEPAVFDVLSRERAYILEPDVFRDLFHFSLV